MKKLAIITTHPIQYNAPLFQLLALSKQIEVKVFYTWGKQVLESKYDPGFQKVIEWDIPLLQGYDFAFVNNIAKDPGSHHYLGIDNPNLISDIVTWNPTSLLIYGWNFKSHLKVLRYFHKKKQVIFRGDSTLLDQRKDSVLKKLSRNLVLKWVYRHVDIALYAGKANKSYFLSNGLKERQLVFAPHAIDNGRYADIKENLRSSLNIPSHAIVFLFAGKLELKKDPVLLLESFMSLKNEEHYLMIVGNGILENELKAIAAAYGITGRILFLDFQNQRSMPSIYQAADVFVLPSKGPGETWGLSVNEAMAAGTAILLSDKCGSYIDLVQNGKNGFVFESENKSDLAEKMRTITIDKDKLKEFGQNSQDLIKNWNFTSIASAIENVVCANYDRR